MQKQSSCRRILGSLDQYAVAGFCRISLGHAQVVLTVFCPTGSAIVGKCRFIRVLGWMTGLSRQTHCPSVCSLPRYVRSARQDRFPRFLSAPTTRGDWRLLEPVFAFISTRSFHAVRSAPVSTSSLAAARRICVCPIFPQPLGIGRKISGASSTNAACCSGVSIRFPYPSDCEASEANFLPPTRKAGNPAWEYSSTPSRLRAILRKSAGVIAQHPNLRAYLISLLTRPRNPRIGVPVGLGKTATRIGLRRYRGDPNDRN